MTLWKYFLIFVLQLATLALASGDLTKDYRPKTLILTEDLQRLTTTFNVSSSSQEIRLDRKLVTGYDCKFKLRVDSTGLCSDEESDMEGIEITPSVGKNVYRFSCGNQSIIMYPLTHVLITRFPTWTNLSSEASFSLVATIYECSWMISWTFILTRLAIAIVFILIPTLVVYLLFYRRQVAMHRARLVREAELMRRRNYAVAVIDMERKYANDHPPTYNDVYDTEAPPPCFCEAVGQNMEVKSANPNINDLNQSQPTEGQNQDLFGEGHDNNSTSSLTSESPGASAQCPCKRL